MELECRGRESPGQTSKHSEPLQDAQVAMRSDLESEQKLTPQRGVERGTCKRSGEKRQTRKSETQQES